MASAYSPSQISQYENYIKLPKKYHQSSRPELNLEYLTTLHIHQICRVPYENLALHYSTHATVDLDPQFLFRKIVGDARGRGGYCMENSIFFNHVLRALGFTVYTAGVRIRRRDKNGVPSGDYIGWVHVVNIVTLPSGEKYMLDVGFGGDQATVPVPLTASPHPIVQNLGTQQIRVIHSTIPQQTDQSKLLWIYQYRNSEAKEWNSYYAFPEVEFLEEDFHIISFFTSTSMGEMNFQTKTILGVRFLLGEDEEGEGAKVVGKVLLVDGVVKRNDGGRTRILFECKDEVERVKALKEHFDINLKDEEVSGIKGRLMELGKVLN